MNKKQLATRIAETAILHGDFTLRSGRKSTWYIDKYLFTTKPDILIELGKMFETNIPETATLLAGAELGGIPLVNGRNGNKPSLYFYSQPKERVRDSATT